MNQTRSDQLGASRAATDSEVLTAVTKMLKARGETMKGALKTEFGEQLKGGKHLDEGTPERAYWHAGYVTALHDVLRIIENREGEWPMKDMSGIDTPDY